MMHKHDFHGVRNDRLRRLATVASLATATVLIAAKIVGYVLTGSVAVLSSLLDSIFDLMASAITAFGVASASKPPDHNHRYGHGKAEPLAALAQAIFMIGTSLGLGYEAVLRFSHPQPVAHEGIGYLIMGLSIVLTVLLVSFQHHVVHRTGSVAIHADRLHYVGDVAVNLAVVAAFLLNHFTGMLWFDPVFGVAIASGLLVTAFQMLRHALFALMDAELPDAQREKIHGITLRQPGVHGCHDMRTRSDGERIFVEMHVEMDAEMPLRAAHELSEKIATAIRAEIANAEIIIHQDPAGLIEDRLDSRIARHAD